MERFFNTAGPSDPQKHYCLSPLERIDLSEIIKLIDSERYFILHAPRQTGKTTCLLTLMKYLNEGGQYKCLYVNVEAGQAERENIDGAVRAILTGFPNRHLPPGSRLLPCLLCGRPFYCPPAVNRPLGMPSKSKIPVAS